MPILRSSLVVGASLVGAGAIALVGAATAGADSGLNLAHFGGIPGVPFSGNTGVANIGNCNQGAANIGNFNEGLLVIGNGSKGAVVIGDGRTGFIRVGPLGF